SASGMSGLDTGNTIRTRKLGKRLYICGDGTSDVDNDGTLFAPRVMLCAAHQANTVLRIVTEKFDV
ncbi:MAG: sulfur carrier protein ThiS adenylyltransferase ThiF, partial [Oscillospiraceae bacterium]|nr:sulfur carrier protein ThiS adenylyltransferase ThiF [Oscillospiraceae bacterium]